MNSSFDWRDMLRFDKMIAPTFLTILYYIQVTISVLASLWFIMKGMDSPYGGGFMVMSGLAGLVLGPFVIRLFYELLIVIFKIHTRLTNIDYALRGPVAGVLPAVNPGLVPANPYGSPAGPAPAPYPSTFATADQPTVVQPVQNPGATPLPQQPIGFQVPVASPPFPTDLPSATGQPMPDFWSTGNPPPATTPVPPVELGNMLQKVPNWPAALAALLVLYAVLSPYAVIGYGSPSSLGQLMGLTYSIKNSSLGIVVVLSALVMLVTSAGGLKWLWFVGAYGLTLLGSLFAFLDETSVFSQLSKAKATMSGVGSTLGDFLPQADQLSQQMAANVPSASQFLNTTFYLFVLSMLFLGYWALAGKYQESGLITVSNH